MDTKLTFRIANIEDKGLVGGLMRELIDELGSGDGNRDIKSKLESDIELALKSEVVRIFLAFEPPDL